MLRILYLAFVVGAVSACHPECRYQCSDPVCTATCAPVCERPACSMINNTEPCEPRCSVECAADQCESDQCPACQVLCEAPPARCGPHAEIQCGPLACAWQCEIPVRCPKPICHLQCEKPACELGTDVVLDTGACRTTATALAILVLVLVATS